MSVASQIERIANDRDIIREKLVDFGLVDNTANLDECAEAVDSIDNNGGVVASVKEGESYTIPAGYHDGSGVISGIAGGGNYSLQSKSVTPTKSQLNITPDAGNYGLSEVTVAAIPAAYQDVTAVTAAAGDVLSTKVFVDSTGKVTTGTMPNNGAVAQNLDTNTTSYTIPAGYHNGSGKVQILTETKEVTPTKEVQNVTPTSGKVLSKVTVNAIPAIYADVTDATADASMILDGQTAYVGGTDAEGNPIALKIEGTMPNNGAFGDNVLDGTTTSITIPAGYTTGGTVSIDATTVTVTPKTTALTITADAGSVYSSVTVPAVDITVPAANLILAPNKVTVESNGITLKEVTGTIASKAAATYYPSTTDLTISASQYLSGAQTIKAVTTNGITAANIKHGVVAKVGDSADDDRVLSVTGSFYNDGTTYTLSEVGTKIDMGATSSHRYITTDGLQVIPTAAYNATGAVSNLDITTYGKLNIAEGSVDENAGKVSGTTFTLGTVSATAGWVTAGTKVSGATFANAATNGQTYLDISDTTAAPILVSGNYLYINKGYTDNVKISLAKLVPDAAVLPTDNAPFMLSGYSAYDNDGNIVSGSIESLAATSYSVSATDQTIEAGKYLAGAQTIKAVTTSNIDADNIKYNVVAKVGDADAPGSIKNVTGTFTGDGTATAGQILSGQVAYVKGAKVVGTLANKTGEANNLEFNALTEVDKVIPAGYYDGTAKVVLTDDLEEALAAI